VSRATPDDYPTLDAVQAMPAWDRLRQAALDAGAVFARRGKLSEDIEEM
jgi:predicted transcriptional regulator